MAKQPVKIPIVPVRAGVKRRWREDQLQNGLIALALLVVALVAGLAGYGALDEYVLVPRRAVATVGQSSINMLSFEKSVRYKHPDVPASSAARRVSGGLGRRRSRQRGAPPHRRTVVVVVNGVIRRWGRARCRVGCRCGRRARWQTR